MVVSCRVVVGCLMLVVGCCFVGRRLSVGVVFVLLVVDYSVFVVSCVLIFVCWLLCACGFVFVVVGVVVIVVVVVLVDVCVCCCLFLFLFFLFLFVVVACYCLWLLELL